MCLHASNRFIPYIRMLHNTMMGYKSDKINLTLSLALSLSHNPLVIHVLRMESKKRKKKTNELRENDTHRL